MTRGPLPLAASVADFVRQSRHNASAGGRRTLLALGGFLDVSVNAHQAGFGNQLRAHLLASFQGSPNVVILERECVDLLLQEVRLDLAGMTEPSGSNSTDRDADGHVDGGRNLSILRKARGSGSGIGS